MGQDVDWYPGSISTYSGLSGPRLYYKFSQKINIKQWLYYSVLLGGLDYFKLSILYPCNGCCL